MELIKKTIGQCLREQAERDGAHTALEMDGWCCSFRQLDRITDKLVVKLDSRGIRHGTHVGIWSINSAEWVVTFLALVKAGAVPILINTCYKQEELKGILNYANVEVLYYGSGYKTTVYEDILAEIREDIPQVRHFLHIDEQRTDFPDSELTLEEQEAVTTAEKSVRAEDTACMIFTSGTTSLPKGVMLSHYNLVNNSRALIEAMHWSAEDRMCITVPLFHCFGITAGIVTCVAGGMTMHLISYFKTARVWAAITEEKCTILNGVPSMFLALIRKQEYAHLRADGLKSGIIAGSPVTKEEFRQICERFPNMHLQPSYGQTETSPCVTIADWEDSEEKKVASAGRVIEHVEVRIADPTTEKVRENDQDGEIQVRGYNIMMGYYNLPKANEKVFTRDGWLKTGDIGHLDKTGELFITGRLKEMIVRAGENIAPIEIEQAIRQIAWVQDVKVIGVPAEILQEKVAACIIPKPGCEVDADAVKEYLKPKLAHYKIPDYVMEFDEFPLNASGKIHLKIMRELAVGRIDEVEKMNKR